MNRSPAFDRASLRLAGALSLAGLVLTMVAGAFHPGRKPANAHPAVFVE